MSHGTAARWTHPKIRRGIERVRVGVSNCAAAWPEPIGEDACCRQVLDLGGLRT